jgi:intracellular septation protein
MMKQALRYLLNDFLSAIAFAIVYALSGSLLVGAAIAIAVGAGQLVRAKLAGRRIETMQWASLALVAVFAGASLLTHSPRFLMAKPSVIHFAIAAIMLRRGWMARYLPEIAQQNLPEPAIVAAGYAWAALMAGLGLANLVIAADFSFAAWAWFISIVPLSAKAIAFGAQYLVFRRLIRRRLSAAATTVPAAAA